MTIVITFALVPLTIDYLDATRYGIWLTLSSIINFFYFFDIGLGNGLRNKFAEALAKNQKALAKKYVSTTYAILTMIIAGVIVLGFIVNPFLDWTSILNTAAELKFELNQLVLIVFIFFGLRLILKLIGVILVADQKPAINNAFGPLSNLISLGIIFILRETTTGSLMYLGTTLSVTPVVVLICASIYFFRKQYRDYIPSLRHIDFSYFSELTGLGVQFFIIQIATVIIFSTDNLIITQILGPEKVTPYNIAHRYFDCVTMLFSIITMPFWSAYTHAFVKEDTQWIKKIMRKLIRIWLGLMLVVVLMIAIANRFYQFWVGPEIEIPFLLTGLMGLYVIIFSWNRTFNIFINGTGKIRLQLYISILVAVLNIPLSIFFARHLGLGSSGVILATSLCLIIGAILAPIQYYRLINKKARGIWDR